MHISQGELVENLDAILAFVSTVRDLSCVVTVMGTDFTLAALRDYHLDLNGVVLMDTVQDDFTYPETVVVAVSGRRWILEARQREGWTQTVPGLDAESSLEVFLVTGSVNVWDAFMRMREGRGIIRISSKEGELFAPVPDVCIALKTVVGLEHIQTAIRDMSSGLNGIYDVTGFDGLNRVSFLITPEGDTHPNTSYSYCMFYYDVRRVMYKSKLERSAALENEEEAMTVRSIAVGRRCVEKGIPFLPMFTPIRWRYRDPGARFDEAFMYTIPGMNLDVRGKNLAYMKKELDKKERLL